MGKANNGQRWWKIGALLVAVVGLIAGGVAQHTRAVGRIGHVEEKAATNGEAIQVLQMDLRDQLTRMEAKSDRKFGQLTEQMNGVAVDVAGLKAKVP